MVARDFDSGIGDTEMIIERLVMFFFGFFAGFVLCASINYAFAADLPLPKPRKPPEMCLQTGRQPFAGQTLQADKTCPSGLRWRFQR